MVTTFWGSSQFRNNNRYRYCEFILGYYYNTIALQYEKETINRDDYDNKQTWANSMIKHSYLIRSSLSLCFTMF